MPDFDYDSYCGLYCGACSMMMAHRTGNKDNFASFWNEEIGFELKCHGCKTDTVFAGCTACEWRACARNRGVERCLACSDFPCALYPQTDGTKEVLEKLPHLKTMRQNLLAIHSIGAEQWLADQEERWKCPECQTAFSWYATACPKCGTDLEKVKDFESVFDKSVLADLQKGRQQPVGS